MGRRVLDVGNCSSDHGRIRRLICEHFDAEVVRALDADEALAALSDGPFDLVLVNRKLYGDYSDGVDLIRKIKADAALPDTAVMLISNYADAQQQAAAAGAEPGFGKAELSTDETRRQLAKHLS